MRGPPELRESLTNEPNTFLRTATAGIGSRRFWAYFRGPRTRPSGGVAPADLLYRSNHAVGNRAIKSLIQADLGGRDNRDRGSRFWRRGIYVEGFEYQERMEGEYA